MNRYFMNNNGKMSVALVVLALLGLLIVISVSWGIKVRNNMVVLEEGVNEKWAQVQNVYQRRADLVPNLVNTVKGYAAHERETLEAVTTARSQATSISPEALKNAVNDPAVFKQFQEAQQGLSSALSRLLLVVERYPDLKAAQNFLTLQSQLEGTENRITVERMRYNEAARQFNTDIRLFPKSTIASWSGFERKAFFEAEKGADKAPEVNF